MSRIITSNLDSWLQARTQQRYSYQSLRDMAAAFHAGLQSSYNVDDIDKICDNAILLTIHEILRNNFIYDYSLQYQIEITDYSKLEDYLRKIRDNGPKDEHYNDLCRMLKVFNVRHMSSSEVCEQIIARLGKRSTEPKYPDTAEVDNKILSNVKKKILYLIKYYKNIKQQIIENVVELQNRRS